MKYLPGRDNPEGNKVVDTDERQIGNNQSESVYEILRWDYSKKKSPKDRLEQLKKECSQALEQRKGQPGLQCTVDPETEGLADEQTEIWESEKDEQ